MAPTGTEDAARPGAAMVPARRSGAGRRLPEPAVRVAAIATGGSLGTLARYGVGRALVPAPLGFPWSTFAVNVAGSFLLGFILILVVERWPPTRFVRPFAALGLVASLAAGLAAVALGMTAARGGTRPSPGDRSIPDPDDLGVLGPDEVAPQ